VGPLTRRLLNRRCEVKRLSDTDYQTGSAVCSERKGVKSKPHPAKEDAVISAIADN